MLQLLAEGTLPRQRCRFTLQPGSVYRLGRSAETDLPVPWERCLSREHLSLKVNGSLLMLTQSAEARNPVFVKGEAQRTTSLRTGEHFVIGETKFHVSEASTAQDSPDGQPFEEVTFTPRQLRLVRFADADRRIDVLSRLPEVIWGARNEAERNTRLVNLLLAGIPHAEAVAIVSCDAQGHIRIPHWDRRRETAGSFRPSKRLVSEALVKRRQSVLHVWESSDLVSPDYTASADFDWAFCTPVARRASAPWGVYVAGRIDSVVSLGVADAGNPPLHADVKFTELVAEIISSVERLNRVESDVSVLRQFLSPPILKALERGNDDEAGLDTQLLQPRECEVTVLFCDLRGFSQRVEESADDLLGVLDRVSKALEVMTGRILEFGGVTGEFLGDAALGFWGWPFASEESVLKACQAALAIRRTFTATSASPRPPLGDFRVGIGIAHGRAVAGRIGTSDRITVTVFGPVVNLASRLETMTKQLRVPILLDEPTATILKRRMGPEMGRLRRLGRVLPFGLETPLTVTELLPPEAELSELTSSLIHQYEQGVDYFIAGAWEEAYRCLHAMPPSDRAQDFLTLRIAEHNRVAPPGWDGIIRLPEK